MFPLGGGNPPPPEGSERVRTEIEIFFEFFEFKRVQPGPAHSGRWLAPGPLGLKSAQHKTCSRAQVCTRMHHTHAHAHARAHAHAHAREHAHMRVHMHAHAHALSVASARLTAEKPMLFLTPSEITCPCRGPHSAVQPKEAPKRFPRGP